MAASAMFAAIALVLSAAPAGAEFDEAASDDAASDEATASADIGRQDTARQPVSNQSFTARFKPFTGPPGPLSLPPGAVDLDSFDAPRGPQVIRTLGTGVASYYGRRFHGRRTANGETFDMDAMTAAHKSLPFGTFVQVTNPRNGRSVTVRINDRGPFIRGRTIDLSRAAASELGIVTRGHGLVQLDVVAP